MDKKMTMIIAAVVVVVVVAAGAFVMIGNDDDDKKKDAPIASQLQIMGNANDDYTINSADKQIIQDIVDGVKSKEDYPLADANNDGIINEEDLELVQDLIDRKTGTQVRVLCLDTKGNPTVQTVKYPLRNAVTYASNMQMPALYTNGGKYIAGYFSSSYNVAEASLSSATFLHGTARTITDANWAEFKALSGSLSDKGGIGAVLVDYSGVKQFTAARMGDLNYAKIPCIIYSSADATVEITTVLTLGFLFGGDCETLSVKYAQASWNVIKEINDKVGSYTDAQRTTYMCGTMHIYVAQNDSSFNTSATTAGGLAYYKVNETFKNKYAGDGSSKMNATDALSNFTDVGKFINNRSMDWGLTATEKKDLIVETWEHDNSGTKTSAFFAGMIDNLTFVNNLLPGAVRLAYMAHALYGNEFSIAWADGVLEDFIDMGTEPLKNQSVDTILAYVDKGIFEAAKA